MLHFSGDWCCTIQDIAVAHFRRLMLHNSGDWCCTFQEIDAALFRRLMLHDFGDWYCTIQEIYVALFRRLMLHNSEGWCCTIQEIRLMLPNSGDLWWTISKTIALSWWILQIKYIKTQNYKLKKPQRFHVKLKVVMNTFMNLFSLSKKFKIFQLIFLLGLN